MKNKLLLRPIHYACVSGGKDSLYMFYYILNHLDKYPLDYVVNYELETDYPFIKEVVNKIESICKKLNIPFMRIKPSKNFNELYLKYGYPSRRVRWCNSKYKLDSDRQFKKLVKSWNCRPVAYIGFCRNEEKRFKYNLGDYLDKDVCYPLAEEGINESMILEWAKNQEIYNGYYRYFKRCGCMGCPMHSMKEWNYIYRNYNDKYNEIMDKIKNTELRYNIQYFYYPLEKFKNKIENLELKEGD